MALPGKVSSRDATWMTLESPKSKKTTSFKGEPKAPLSAADLFTGGRQAMAASPTLVVWLLYSFTK